MATNTPDAGIPVASPQAPGAPAVQPMVNEAAPAPDPRDVAASSKMPYVPAPVSSSSAKLSSITAALGYNRFTPRTFKASYLTPSFILMSLVISSIDRLMVHTYRFNQSNPDWHPYITQVYYGIIFVVHVLRVKRSAQTINEDESTFIEWFEGNWPFASLPVAGPLKHFLQSITVVSGPSKFYGNVSPASPPSFKGTPTRFYEPDHPATMNHWPAVPVLMDMINDMLDAGNRQHFNPQDATHWQRYYLPLTHLFGQPVTNEGVFALPGMTDLVTLPSTSMPTWYNSASNLMFPPRLNSGNTPTTSSIAEYLRFGTSGDPHFTWFPAVIGMMQRHAQFLKDSTSLASISSVGLAAELPLLKPSRNANISLRNAAAGQVISPVAAIPAEPNPAPGVPPSPGRAQGYRAKRFQHFNVSATSKFEDLHILAEQFSILSCVNLTFTELTARGTNYIALPTDAQTRQGPVWTLPDLKSHPEIDVLGQIVTFLTGSFHNDQRMNK